MQEELKDDDWPSSLDEVAYDVEYLGYDNATEVLICETVVRLPSDVAEFVFDRCRFVSVGKAALGTVLPGYVGTHPLEKRNDNMWLVVLGEEFKEKDAHSIVAHEIAHAWLGHDRLAKDVTVEVEVEACRLVQEWGFTGLGTDVKHCTLGQKA